MRLTRLKPLEDKNHMATILTVKYDGIYHGNTMLFFLVSWGAFSKSNQIELIKPKYIL